MSIKTIITIVVLIVVVGAIFALESRKTDRPGVDVGNTDVTVESDNERIAAKREQYEVAKEISTPDAFINTDSVSVENLVGEKVILVDFWTYSCINCQRTLPYLNSWHDKYADDGLVILGVHTPEFEFEKEYENVKRATEKYNVEYPVILDNDYSTWTAYRNRYWPRKYLIDIDGFIVYDHIGEGAYDETEAKIVELLNERKQVLGEKGRVAQEKESVDADAVDFGQIRTPETYLGYGRMEHIANLPSQACFDAVCEFENPDELALSTYALDGSWNIEKESAHLAEGGGEITIRFSARKVNLVAGSMGGVTADILLDGESITAQDAGVDVENGSTTFTEHDLYNLVDLDEYSEHELIIRFRESGVNAFAFTFG